ncbi:MAG: hypothetical protein ACLFOY_10485 [Desulfatibacillaceae bacterium]
MDKNQHFLLGTFPSSIVFTVVFGVILVVAYFLASSFATDGGTGYGGPTGPAPLPMVLAFAATYGVITGIVLGVFQKKPLRLLYGAVAGMFGAAINWLAIGMALIWFIIYTLYILTVMVVSWSVPAWSLFSDFNLLGKAFLYDSAELVLWGGGLFLGIVLLYLYSRLPYERLYPMVSRKVIVPVLVVLAAIGIAFTALAPRATLEDMVHTMPQRIDTEIVDAGNYAFDFDGMKWTVVVRKDGAEVFEGLSNANTTVSMDKATALSFAVGKKTMFDMTPGETYTVQGDEMMADEGLRFMTNYRPSLSTPLVWLLNLMMLLILGSFSVAPLICVYDTFWHDSLNTGGMISMSEPEPV